MSGNSALLALKAFENAAARVPAYRQLLREAGVRVEDIRTPQDFGRLPILEKQSTFQRFDIQELCKDGVLGRMGTVLTSSGHSGIFAFGVTDADAIDATVQWIDDSLDYLFQVRARHTLLINCLPMGVKVPTRACTLAETSVRPDMAVGLIKSFGGHFEQIVVVAEAAFLKHVLETGKRSGIEWRDHVVHVILGEEPLAENARRYLGGLLGHELKRPERGVVFSSMGVAELGLNLFFEMPPTAPLIALRRLLHDDEAIRTEVMGAVDWVPSLFTFDPRRIFVEFASSGQLVLTTLDLELRIPLIRYAPGDRGAFVQLPPGVRPMLENHGLSWDTLNAIPIVAIDGRGEHASAGESKVYPEAVKEGIYLEPALAALTTANFRLASGAEAADVRIQLSPGVRASPELDERFSAAISSYVRAPLHVTCHEYVNFRGGMELDYERKFRYLEQ